MYAHAPPSRGANNRPLPVEKSQGSVSDPRPFCSPPPRRPFSPHTRPPSGMRALKAEAQVSSLVARFQTAANRDQAAAAQGAQTTQTAQAGPTPKRTLSTSAPSQATQSHVESKSAASTAPNIDAARKDLSGGVESATKDIGRLSTNGSNGTSYPKDTSGTSGTKGTNEAQTNPLGVDPATPVTPGVPAKSPRRGASFHREPPVPQPKEPTDTASTTVLSAASPDTTQLLGVDAKTSDSATEPPIRKAPPAASKALGNKPLSTPRSTTQSTLAKPLTDSSTKPAATVKSSTSKPTPSPMSSTPSKAASKVRSSMAGTPNTPDSASAATSTPSTGSRSPSSRLTRPTAASLAHARPRSSLSASTTPLYPASSWPISKHPLVL